MLLVGKMNDSTPLTPHAFLKQISHLWPILKGSLAKVHKPCIRPGCRACQNGEKHPAYIFSFTQNGKRRCMYVPQDLVPIIQQGIKNGRRLEATLYALGEQLIRQHRKHRADKAHRHTAGPKTGSKS